MKSLRILTTVHFANPGACLFSEAIEKNLAQSLPEYDVRILDYVPRNWYYYELARILKIHSRIPAYNIQRHLVSERFYRQHTHLDKPSPFYPIGYDGMVRYLSSQAYDALVVGMVIWDLVDKFQIPKFPSIYWLSEKIPSVKIAYAASGHRSLPEFIERNLPDVGRILSSYALIGVRDQLTLEIVLKSGADRHVPVMKVPDPTFLYDVQPTNVDELLRLHGVDSQRPLAGMLFYGKSDFSQALADHFHRQGFQTVGFSLYNPFADINLGHVLSPHEWADLFSRLSFCVTDRFHGTAFSLKAKIPFISIEPFAAESARNSKVNSLLEDFGLSADCYRNPYSPSFEISEFLAHADELRFAWERDFKPRVQSNLVEMARRNQDFLSRIQQILA